MPKRHSSAQSLYFAQVARFNKVNKNALQGMQILRRDALDEMTELTSGSPQGKARLRLLRAMGFPFARDDSPLDTDTMRMGGKRGNVKSGKRLRKKLQIKGKVNFPQLPIGKITGALQRAKFASTDRFKLTLGFDRRAGRSINVVIPWGTNKMVGRGLWLPGERGELGKRMKRARRAFAKVFFDPLRRP